MRVLLFLCLSCKRRKNGTKTIVLASVHTVKNLLIEKIKNNGGMYEKNIENNQLHHRSCNDCNGFSTGTIIKYLTGSGESKVVKEDTYPYGREV